MFDFQTNTIINSTESILTKLDREITSENPAKDFRLKRGISLNKDYIKNIYYCKNRKAIKDKVVFTIPDLTNYVTEKTNVFRFYINMRLRNSNNPLFANAEIYKGKPLMLEIALDKDQTNEDLANKVSDLVDSSKNNLELFKLDGKDIITIESKVEGETTKTVTITVTAGTEFMYFKDAKFEHSYRETIYTDYSQYAWEEIKGVAVITNGNVGFGTNDHMLRDIRIPSDANIRFKHLYPDEDIIQDAVYDQFIIDYEVPRESLTGQSAVGETLVTKTTHILWVLSNAENVENTLSAKVKTYLEKLHEVTDTSLQ